VLLGNNQISRNFLRIVLIGGLCLVLIAVISPIVLRSFGFDVKVQRCFHDAIPCGWSSSLFRTGTERK
jgi:hypothetical protein